MAAGAALGLNRNLRGKAAGVRTHALVSLGAAVATAAAARVAGGEAATRVIQGVITGIGFIGGGVILHPRTDAAAGAPARGHERRRGDVRGLTTAATVWMASALGVACGTGLWVLAVAGTLLTLLVLAAGGPLEGAVKSRLRQRRAARARARAARAARAGAPRVTGAGRPPAPPPPPPPRRSG